MTELEARLDVRVQQADFDLAVEYAALRERAPGVGAIAAFCGCVRDLAEDTEVAMLELEHYPGVTEGSLRRVAAQACTRWPVVALTVVHRVGRLDPGDQIVLVLTASAHRQAAFDSARYVMDYLKTCAVFWKKEYRRDGAHWIESRAGDQAAVEAWRRNS